MDELVVPALHLPDSRLIAQIIRELQLDCLEERISFPHLLAKLTAVTESNGGAIALYDEPSSALSAIAQALPNGIELSQISPFIAGSEPIRFQTLSELRANGESDTLLLAPLFSGYYAILVFEGHFRVDPDAYWAVIQPLLLACATIIKAMRVYQIQPTKPVDRFFENASSLAEYGFYKSPLGKLLIEPRPDGKLQLVNQTFCQWLGYSMESLMTKCFQDLIHPDDRAVWREQSQRILQGDVDQSQWELRLIPIEGQPLITSFCCALPQAEDGQPLYFMCHVQDLTEQKLILETTKHSQELFRRTFEEAPIPKALISAEGRFILVNQQLCKMTGYTEAELLALNFQDITHPDDLIIGKEMMPLLLSGRLKYNHFTKRYVHKSGRVIWTEVGTSVIQKKNGEFDCLVSQFVDISDYKSAEIALTQAKLTAELATERKSEFLATMSHEIRTPLNALLGLNRLLLDTELNAEQRELLNTSQSSGDALLNIINNILDFSKLEAGKIELNREIIHLASLLRQAVSMLKDKARTKGLRLSFSISELLPERVIGDPYLLMQVLLNLIENAIKFSDSGSITIRVKDAFPEEDDASEDGLVLQFEVEDQGAGIPEDKYESIFESFIQLTPTISRTTSGTGLGLAICKRLVGVMGGKVWLVSQATVGTSFFFTVPFKRVDASSEESSPWPPNKAPLRIRNLSEVLPLNILVAEDNPTNCLLIKLYLEKLGYAPVFAKDGAEAIRLAESQDYELILMDIQMPEIDGLEATRQIRKNLSPPERVKIIAMTAFVSTSDQEKSYEAGMDAFLAKPISSEALENVILNLFHGQSAQIESKPKKTLYEQILPSLHINLPDHLNNPDYSPAVLRELFSIFTEECIRLQRVIILACQEQDVKRALHATHELRGNCMNIGACHLREIASTLETTVRKELWEDTPGLIALMNEAISILETELLTFLHDNAGND